MSARQQQRGVVLVVILVLLSALSLLAAMSSQSALDQWRLVGNYQQSEAARLRAERAMAGAVAAWPEQSASGNLGEVTHRLVAAASLLAAGPGDELSAALSFSGCYASAATLGPPMGRYRLDLTLITADGSRYDLQRIVDAPPGAAPCAGAP